MKILLISSTLLLFILSSCVSSKDKKEALFTILSSSQTNVDFNNKIVEDDSTNMFVNEYTYMGDGNYIYQRDDGRRYHIYLSLSTQRIFRK